MSKKRQVMFGTGQAGCRTARGVREMGIDVRGVNRSGKRPDLMSEVVAPERLKQAWLEPTPVETWIEDPVIKRALMSRGLQKRVVATVNEQCCWKHRSSASVAHSIFHESDEC